VTWFKVDDGLAFHAKVVQAGNPAMGLWVRAGSWCAQQLTDGFVPDHIVATLGSRAQAKRLVEVGLWHREGAGYRFHQWDEDGRQPTRAVVEKERAEARERMRKAREAKRAEAAGSTEVRANTERSSGDVRSTRPDPSRPDPSRPLEEEALGGDVASVDARDPKPPLYSDRCSRHADVAEPGPCGGCADARKATRRLAVVGPHNPARKPHCGECDETRHIETPVGIIRCPNCHPNPFGATA
jgi:hypothetical protein